MNAVSRRSQQPMSTLSSIALAILLMLWHFVAACAHKSSPSLVAHRCCFRRKHLSNAITDNSLHVRFRYGQMLYECMDGTDGKAKRTIFFCDYIDLYVVLGYIVLCFLVAFGAALLVFFRCELSCAIRKREKEGKIYSNILSVLLCLLFAESCSRNKTTCKWTDFREWFLSQTCSNKTWLVCDDWNFGDFFFSWQIQENIPIYRNTGRDFTWMIRETGAIRAF